MSKQTGKTSSALPPELWPPWFNGNSINEAIFCQEFLTGHPLVFTENAFFNVDGLMTNEAQLKTEIYQMLEPCATTNVSKKIGNIIELLKITAYRDDLRPHADRIHVANGTLLLDGRFSQEKNRIVRNRLPVRYDPTVDPPYQWLSFLNDLLYPEDIPTLQEFIGYCLIPSTAAQKMMVIKGNGGEGKSQIGTVLARMFGCNAKDGSIGKVSENRFARADL